MNKMKLVCWITIQLYHLRLQRKFLSTKLMVVTSEGKIIELKNDFASDKMDDAVIYIKSNDKRDYGF